MTILENNHESVLKNLHNYLKSSIKISKNQFNTIKDTTFQDDWAIMGMLTQNIEYAESCLLLSQNRMFSSFSPIFRSMLENYISIKGLAELENYIYLLGSENFNQQMMHYEKSDKHYKYLELNRDRYFKKFNKIHKVSTKSNYPRITFKDKFTLVNCELDYKVLYKHSSGYTHTGFESLANKCTEVDTLNFQRPSLLKKLPSVCEQEILFHSIHYLLLSTQIVVKKICGDTIKEIEDLITTIFGFYQSSI